jgi:glycosyltransferase involved in cell wall biosynthesis
MQITHLVEDLRLGGMETLVADLARGQRNAGHGVEVVCLKHDGETADQLRREEFRVTVIGVDRVRPATLLQLRRTLRPSGPDVVHLHGMPAGTFGRLALLGTGIGSLVHIHTQISVAHSITPRIARRERLLSRLPGAILAISESVRRDLVEQLGLSAGRIDVLSGGVPDVATPDRALARTQFGLEPADFAIVCLASLKAHKGQDILIRAIANLEGVKLLLAGEGPFKEELIRLVDELGAAGSVRFLGHVEEVPELLVASDAVALASWPREGLSLSLVEGLRAGRPAVVSDVGGLPEVVEDGVNGFVVPPKDPAAFAEAFERLLLDPSIREEMGQKSRARFLERYELSGYLTQLEGFYRSLGSAAG